MTVWLGAGAAVVVAGVMVAVGLGADLWLRDRLAARRDRRPGMYTDGWGGR